MLKSLRLRLALAIALAGSLLTSYTWACYVAGQCTCAVVGGCYSSKVLPDCNISTCVIADSAAVVWNVCPGTGPYTSRQASQFPSSCCPANCRMWNACTHQYVALSGMLCCFTFAQYVGVGSGCK